jgi:hypothetical protein
MSQTAGHLYRLSADLSNYHDTTWEGAKRAAMKFEKEIAALARQRGETIYFHTYKDPARVPHSDTHVLLECSETFVEEVKKLSAFGTLTLRGPSTSPLDTMQTVRREDPQTPRQRPGTTPPHTHP